MSRILSVLAIGVSLLGAAACTPSNLYQGFQAIDASPNDVKVGTDNRSTVMARLGTPTATDTFDKDTWFYLTQMSNKTAFYHPRVVRRNVVAISFDKDTQAVKSVDVYGLKDGRVIAYNNRVTPTRGRELTVLEQMFGSLSSVGTLPQDDNYTPGSHPGDTH
ncbi:MAG TPA: outer membrane protein assembly factor BamE [Caulobacteraceae bacterium]|jgi:outer membrane protein assembly factor BamE (lipoprotein component of BamABCDE complex)